MCAMRSPVHQIRKGQQWSAELSIQPDTEVMQGHLRRHAPLQPAEVMRPFPLETECMPELLIPGRHDLASPRPPAPEPLGPRCAAMALRGTDDLGALGLPPGVLGGVPLDALIDNLRPVGRGPAARQARGGRAAQGKARLRPGGILRTRRPKTEAGAPPHGGDRQEQLPAFVPAQPVAPAHSGQARPPAPAPALGVPCRDTGAVQGFVRTPPGRQPLEEGQKTRHERLLVLTDVAMALLARGQRGQGGAPMLVRRAIHTARTAKALPLPEEGQGHHCAPAKRGLRPRVWLRKQGGRAKSIDHHVESRQEGVHINQSSAPSLGEERAILPARGTFRVSISCQLTPSV